MFRSVDRTVYIEGVVVFCYATNFPTNANTVPVYGVVLTRIKRDQR